VATKKKAKVTTVKKAKQVVPMKRRKAKKKKTLASFLPVTTIKTSKSIAKKGGIMEKKKRSTKKQQPGGKSGVMDTVMLALYGLASGIGLSIVANKLPISDARVKAALPIAGGFGILAIPEGKPDIKAAAAVGSMIIGGLSMVRAVAPTIPMLAGEDDYILLPADSLSGDYRKLSGNYNRISGSVGRHLSPASIG